MKNIFIFFNPAIQSWFYSRIRLTSQKRGSFPGKSPYHFTPSKFINSNFISLSVFAYYIYRKEVEVYLLRPEKNPSALTVFLGLRDSLKKRGNNFFHWQRAFPCFTVIRLLSQKPGSFPGKSPYHFTHIKFIKNSLYLTVSQLSH